MNPSIPSLQGNLEHKIHHLIHWMGDRIKLVRWTNEEIQTYYGRRSAHHIIQNKTTGYMGPCLDLTATALAALQKNHEDPILVIEEVQQDPFPFPRLHFALEFQTPEGPFHLDFQTGYTVLFNPGAYKNTNPQVIQLTQTRIPGKTISPAQPLSTSLGLSSPQDLDRLFPHVSFNASLERMQHDNTPERYEAYQRRYAHPGRFSLNALPHSSDRTLQQA